MISHYSLHQRLSCSKIGRFVKGIIEKWPEDIPKEMAII